MVFFTILFLALMEVALSFDNAVLNAAVLKNMSAIWQRRFITWGMLIAVLGMRLLFPIAIVSLTTYLPPIETFQMALHNPEKYAEVLTTHKAAIDAFGGAFLLMIFLKFLFEEKEICWLGRIEKKLGSLGKFESLEIGIAQMIVFALYLMCHECTLVDITIFTYGTFGILSYIVLKLFMGDRESISSGLGSFIYLEALDASCSFDGVIGAFVLTNNILQIMIGLGIGAFLIRSLTLYLVKGGILKDFIYLEHGANYAIGALAAIMLTDIFYPVPEPITGMAGISLIGLSLLTSIRK